MLLTSQLKTNINHYRLGIIKTYDEWVYDYHEHNKYTKWGTPLNAVKLTKQPNTHKIGSRNEPLTLVLISKT